MIVRTALTLGIVAALAGLPGCESAPTTVSTQPSELTNVAGTIEAVNPDAGWYGIVPDGDRGTRYAPDRLPDTFKKDGLRVVFSGRVGRVDPNVRTWGIPLILTNIRPE